MITENDYELLKNSFVESQTLFNKLHKVSSQAGEIDYDESGLYQDDEERCKRHWLKLSSKIVDKMSDDLQDYSIELLENELLTSRELRFNIIKDEEVSKVYVDYSVDGELNIVQDS